MIVVMPAGFLDLDDNIFIQFSSFLICFVSLAAFTVQFAINGIDVSRTATIGPDLNSFIGLLLFGYAFIVTVPSWVNVKEDPVSVNKPLWIGTTATTLIFIYFGLMGAWSYSSVTTANLLSEMASDPGALPTTVIFSFLFTFFEIGLGIPLFSIYIRQNLITSGVCRPALAAFWGTAFPWLIGWLLLQGNAFTVFENWTSLLINAAINFLAPFVVFIVAKLAGRPRGKRFYSRWFHKLLPAHVHTPREPEPRKHYALPRRYFSRWQIVLAALLFFSMFVVITVAIVLNIITLAQ
jgi:hypothetical protein